MTSSSGVQKSTLVASYAPTPHAFDALMKALDDSAVLIKKEPEPDAIDDGTFSTRAHVSFPLIHTLKMEPEPIDEAIPTIKQEPGPKYAAADANMMEPDATKHNCSDASTDEYVKDDCRSRLSSISGFGPDSETNLKVEPKHEVYLANDPKSIYNTIIRGTDLNVKVEHSTPKHEFVPKVLSDSQLLAMATKTFKSYGKGLVNGDTSREARVKMLGFDDRKVYLEHLRRLKGLEEFNWTSLDTVSLSALAASASSRSNGQESQLLEALRSCRSPTDIQQYLGRILPEGGLAQRSRTLNVKFQRDVEELAKQKEAGHAKKKALELAQKRSILAQMRGQQQTYHLADLERMRVRQSLRDAEAQDHKERSAQWMVEQLLKEQAEQAKRKAQRLEDQRADLVKEGIETRRRLAPRRLVTESESFLIGRLVIEERSPEAAAEFIGWANTKMNDDEKEEYNRMLYILKGQDAWGKMVDVAGRCEIEDLLSQWSDMRHHR